MFAFSIMLTLAVAAAASSITQMALAVSSTARNSNPIVDLGYVKYRGVVNSTNGFTAWYGLRYAAPPKGQLRWQAPVPIEKNNNYSFDQVLDATSSGPICLQQYPPWTYQGAALLRPVPGINGKASEDCLLLNVKTPSKPAGPKLAVMVQIHGGGYIEGDAATTPGDYLVSESRGQLIYVEIQYRLGGLGFLNNAEVRKAGTANAGLLDQRTALEWVQRHISSFGGDPNKVTIIGGSSGGGSVSAQVQLFGGVSRPPFRAAIAEFPWLESFHDEKIFQLQYEGLLKSTKCDGLGCLRDLPFESLATGLNQTLFNAYFQKRYGYGDAYWGPSVDGHIIKELPHSAFQSGRVSRVPYLVDRCGLEGLAFSNTSIKSAANVRSDLQRLWPAVNASFFNTLDKLYPVSAFKGSSYFKSPVIAATAPDTLRGQMIDGIIPGLQSEFDTQNSYFYKRQEIYGDAFINCPTRTMASSLVRLGVPVYKLIYNSGLLYHSTVDQSIFAPASAYPGILTEQESATLRAYFISFATHLDPNSNPAFKNVSRPVWQEYGAGANALYDNFTKFANGRDTDSSARCQFWLEQGDVILN